jgi:hypothetical protein
MPYFRGEVVTDAYLQSLLTAFRQAYVNAGGPDYEDSDQPLLDLFAARGIVDTSGAAGAGRDQAAIDKAAGQEYHVQSLAPGGVIPTTAPKVSPATVPPVINTATSGGDAVAFMTLSGLPTMGGSAAPQQGLAPLIAAGASPITMGGSTGGGGIAGIPWLLIIGVAVAGWYLLKGKK